VAFNLRFSDKEITAWGGMAVMKRLLDHLGFQGAHSASSLPQLGNNRGYRSEQLITQFRIARCVIQRGKGWAGHQRLTKVLNRRCNALRLLTPYILTPVSPACLAHSIAHQKK
jgi:hypothetical protein